MVGLPLPRLLLAIVAAVTLLGGVGGLVAISWLDHNATEAESSDRLRLSSRLAESHVRALHQAGQEVLARIGEYYIYRPGGAGVRPWLATLVEDAPYIDAVRIQNLSGETILSTDDAAPLTETELADIRTALSQPGRTVIGILSSEAQLGGHAIVLTRAFSAPSGAVLGVARILVSISYFNDLYRDLIPPPGAIFSVLRRDGLLIARYPMPPNSPRLDSAAHPFTKFAEASEGVYQAVSVVDGSNRLLSYRVLPDLDLVVAAGLLTDTVFQDWEVRTQHATFLVSLALLLMLGLTALADRSMRKEFLLSRSDKENADNLAAALADKDVLFQEVHHRVKNNLQVISSLLTMQSLHVRDEVARNTLKDALDRIHSMGLVHQTLYERNLAANVDLGAYFGRLAEGLASSYGSGKGGVTVQVDASGTLELERAVPLGMLANEVLSNALKHAFADGRHGNVYMSLHCEDGRWRLVVRDDGSGIAPEPGRGIGFGLIRALSRQLGGSVQFSAASGGGTMVVVDFPA
ncbi:sensor histidine kinase [Magnetospirillum molischianum]|uniref:histidine kinase n=1 Tax=Magnetospirillum molischianum DSM 120 TaxID=1150626 RepID=H8FTR4_MAGML|nr:histidine kinase dimerization/phosphoacceptor domain -containing protein [Magnetospirillum molischianum]CCG41771.1 Putative two-component sensor histidine kinase, classical system [Magnetospirillum molischianum DSM 120]